MKTLHTLGVLTVLTIAGFGALWAFSRSTDVSTDDTEQHPQSRTDSVGLDALVTELENDPAVHPRVLAAFQEIRQELDGLRRNNAELRRQLAAQDPLANLALADGSASVGENSGEQASDAPATLQTRRRGPVTQERLVAAGFSSSEAEEILTTTHRNAMERLNLQYEATRAGRSRGRDYRDAMAAVPSAKELITEEYGAEGYDKYLYAIGEPNRLVITDVFRESPAEAAQLQPGDMLLRVNGERVYSERELFRIGSQGSSSDSVPVLVEREGAQFEVYVPRGPLGVRLGRGFATPSAPEGSAG